MVVWFCESHIDHNPNTPFSDFSQPYGVANPCGEVGNRTGGHKIGHSCTGTVRPRVISECGTTNNPRPLAYEACLKKTCADSASLDAMESASWHRKPSKSKKIRNSVSTSPGTVQYTRLGNRRSNAPLASPQDGLLSVAMGSIARACMRLHPLRELGSPRRCNRTIRKLERALGPIHYSDRSGST